MPGLLGPGFRLLSRLRFARKFQLVGVLFVLPLGLVLFYFQSEINKGISFVRLEQAGVTYEGPVLQLLEDVLQHQRLVNSFTVNHSASEDDVVKQEQVVDADIKSVDAVDATLGGTLGASGAWSKLKSQWQSVLDTDNSNSESASETAHQAFVDNIVAFIQTVGNNSNLILDPDVDSYYTMDSALTQMPQVVVNVTRAGELASAAAQHHSLSSTDRTNLTVLTGLISSPLSSLTGNVQQVEQFNSSVKSALDPLQNTAVSQTNGFLGTVQQNLLAPNQPTATVEDVEASTQGTADSLSRYRIGALATLQTLLEARENGFTTRRAAVDTCVAISLLLALYFFSALSRSTTDALAEVSHHLNKLNQEYVGSLAGAIEALENGDLTTTIKADVPELEINTQDELGDVGLTANSILVSMRRTVFSFQASQKSLSRLIRSLQSTASYVNHASQSLSETAKDAVNSSAAIGHSVKDINSASSQAALGAHEVAKGSNLQAVAVSQSAALMQKLTRAVIATTDDAHLAAKAVDRASIAAVSGSETGAKSLNGMQNIRTTVIDSAQVIGQLGESSAKIGSIVSTIEDIASQTNLLALNAAIEAARVGEAGRGFAVVADEVRKLADRSRIATAEIKALVEQVQERTAIAVAAIEGGVRDVEAGGVLAREAGGALEEILSEISSANTRVVGILNATNEILATSQEISGQITEVAACVEEASASAEEMSSAVDAVSSSLQNVTSASVEQERSVAQMVNASHELSSIAQELDISAAEFKLSDQETDNSDGKAIELFRAA